MIQILTPEIFHTKNHLLRDAFIRIAPAKSEFTLSSGLLKILGHRPSQKIAFALDSNTSNVYVLLGRPENGFHVTMDGERGKIYSAPMFSLFERLLHTRVTGPISIMVEGIPSFKNEIPMYKLFVSALKQEQTVSNETLAVTTYKGKAHTKEVLLSKIRAYWNRASTSVKEKTRAANRQKYEDLKRHCLDHELDIDFIEIEATTS